MSDIEYFLATYGLTHQDTILVPYGSRVYGTYSPNSDYDYIAIIPAKRFNDHGTEYHLNNTDFQLINAYQFQKQLDNQKVHALEAFFHPDKLCSKFTYTQDLKKLREEISTKSSHSFVKAKKKITVENDYYTGLKSLFHSLRILNQGIQVAKNGKIVDFAASNSYWDEIKNGSVDWDVLKAKWQPVFNRLSTEFKKHAPKD